MHFYLKLVKYIAPGDLLSGDWNQFLSLTVTCHLKIYSRR